MNTGNLGVSSRTVTSSRICDGVDNGANVDCNMRSILKKHLPRVALTHPLKGCKFPSSAP